MLDERVIGRFTLGKKGPLFICIGGMHGDEPAGVMALEEVTQILNQKSIAQAEFKYRGNFLAVKGNMRALQKGLRFIDKDLNRCWTDENIEYIHRHDSQSFYSEQKEIAEILQLLEKEISRTKPSYIIVLDLHTTSASGGIFSMTTEDIKSMKIAQELHAPVITGMHGGVSGSSLHFFSGKNMGIPTSTIGFESGQHEDPLSVNRAIAAVINCMRTIGAVDADQVENKHDDILMAFSKDLPKVSKIVGKYAVLDKAHFKMLPGFQSFQAIEEGQVLAVDLHGEVRSPVNGRILLPSYQKNGEDGFFLIQAEV